eukprot:TRINITY_DN46575_c0_g1_i1.p1 TRINITY_DN46575_c0_g1~~TRINITY_DN46575_c0_g1_i1.p1  ORF type:complete len:417 (+),score=90.84 TRINITY_DN46575_c0_g1_i1:50-1300(+)
MSDGPVGERALNVRRALSEDPPRRTRTLDQSFDEEETPSKKRKLDIGGRSISEVLPHVPLSMENEEEEDIAPTQEYARAMSGVEEDALAQGRCIYLDRIPPDLSDTAIKNALTTDLPPRGVCKVDSLEVIRTQKSRHVHAFAILTTPMTEVGPLDIPVEGGEFIRVHHASKQLRIPTPTKPCKTLHIRIYARRSGWSNNATRMTWAGMLSTLEMVSEGSTSNILMVADDRSTRSRTSHPSVLLCVFFAECATIDAAIKLHDAVHDRTTRGLGDTLFLVRADYARGDKRLHDTSENQDQLKQKFDEAVGFAKSVLTSGEQWTICNGAECPLPEDSREPHNVGLHASFEFWKKGSPEKKKKRPDDASSVHDSPKKRPKAKKHQPDPEDSGLPQKVVMSRGVSQVELPSDNPWNHGRKY